jgi:hypothetical protein
VTKIKLPAADDPVFRAMLELCQQVRHKLEHESDGHYPADFPAAALFSTGLKAYIDLYGRQQTASLLRELAATLSQSSQSN